MGCMAGCMRVIQTAPMWGASGCTCSQPAAVSKQAVRISCAPAACAPDRRTHPQVELLACKFLDARNQGFASNAAACIQYCVGQGARIIQASWSSPDPNQVRCGVGRCGGEGFELGPAQRGRGVGMGRWVGVQGRRNAKGEGYVSCWGR